MLLHFCIYGLAFIYKHFKVLIETDFIFSAEGESSECITLCELLRLITVTLRPFSYLRLVVIIRLYLCVIQHGTLLIHPMYTS